MIKSLWLRSLHDYALVLADGSEREYYSLDIRKLNIFIGRNNSGKSRFIRSIFESTLDDLMWTLDDEDMDEYSDTIERLSQYIPDKNSINSIKGDDLKILASKKLFTSSDRLKFNHIAKNVTSLLTQDNNLNFSSKTGMLNESALRD